MKVIARTYATYNSPTDCHELTITDADLATSLFEYGLAWRELGNGEILFVYAHPTMANRFDRCTMKADLDCKREFNWVKWTEFYATLSDDPDINAQWQSLPLPMKIGDLINHHGVENIFGTSYWEGFT